MDLLPVIEFTGLCSPCIQTLRIWRTEEQIAPKELALGSCVVFTDTLQFSLAQTLVGKTGKITANLWCHPGESVFLYEVLLGNGKRVRALGHNLALASVTSSDPFSNNED